MDLVITAGDTQPGDRLESQATCYDAFFSTFWDKPWFAGAYIWKWYPQHDARGGRMDTDFTPQNKPAEGRMAEWYGRRVTIIE